MDISLILIGIGIAAVFGTVGISIGEAAGAKRLIALREELRIAKNHAIVARHSYAGVEGLWATDRPELIKHEEYKPLFHRIGYPGEKL